MTIVLLILILGLLIFVHEFGHFIAAKKIGVYVSEFALGMGPKIFSFKRKKHNDPTVYSLRLFPIGGFCAMAGEVLEDTKGLKKEEYMCNRSKLERFIILLAGVTMNFITAFVILLLQGFIFGVTEQNSIVGYMTDNSAMKAAGIEIGDKIVKVNGYHVNSWDKMSLVLNLKYDSDTYEFVVKKTDGTTKTYNITPNKEKDQDGNERKVFGFGASQEVKRGFFITLKYAFKKLGSIVASMYLILISLFNGKLSINNLSGPVGMYTIVGESAKAGINSLMYLTAYLSLNLAVINSLPFSALDGGRALFVLIEAIRGKKINPKVENYFHTIGFIILMLLMLYITVQDILRLAK